MFLGANYLAMMCPGRLARICDQNIWSEYVAITFGQNLLYP